MSWGGLGGTGLGMDFACKSNIPFKILKITVTYTGFLFEIRTF